jgi:hypothetical protein
VKPSEHPDNPQRAERRMDDSYGGRSPHDGVERESLHGSDREVEREVLDDRGPMTSREALQDSRGREEGMNASRSGGMENRVGDRSDPMPGEDLH